MVDCTWGAGRVHPGTRTFEKAPNEFFFLTDPEELIYTHFPHDESEKNYQKWQLLSSPISLETFNDMPLLTSMFFEYSLKLSLDLQAPILTNSFVDIKMKAWEVIRYKYKFFLASKGENDRHNSYVMCYCKGKSRKQVCFHVTPPEEGNYLLKIYAKPEEDIQQETDTLDHIATFHITANHVSKILEITPFVIMIDNPLLKLEKLVLGGGPLHKNRGCNF